MTYTTTFCSSLDAISETEWSTLALGQGPFLQYAYLRALEFTGCVGEKTTWQPHHLLVYRDNKLVAAMPGYTKYDSSGEYVFDHGWAHAYEQHGENYYPKWISAVPFTPVTGARLLICEGESSDLLLAHVTTALGNLQKDGYSSCHVLFQQPEASRTWSTEQYLQRFSVQFQWYNYGYQTFDDFTAALTSRKRRALRKSQQKLKDQGITISRLTGTAITTEYLAFFIGCYQSTYLKRSGHWGYLNKAFFQQIFANMADNLLLVVAEINGTPVASALFFFDENGLYGRYWGALEPVDGLHFECCYHQGIAFAIERNLSFFNPGTQGEHKILRGFEPTYCVSLHHLFDTRFHRAVQHFLNEETPQIRHYFAQAAEVLPFNEKAKSMLKTITSASLTPADAITKKSNDNEV